jgi:hypothetical protein
MLLNMKTLLSLSDEVIEMIRPGPDKEGAFYEKQP